VLFSHCYFIQHSLEVEECCFHAHWLCDGSLLKWCLSNVYLHCLLSLKW